jgi:O-antigen/teichoic acid export membrane protein
VTTLEPIGPDAEMTESLAWEGGAARRFVALAGARVIAQGLGMAWFIIAARLLTDAEFGTLATGLVFFAVFAGVGDLGTTRTIVRVVSADRNTLWPAYRRSLLLRLAGGLVSCLLVVVLVTLLDTSVPPVIVGLAGLVATASGATELAYAGLRSVGKVRFEMVALVAERAAFVAVGVGVLALGGGAEAVLLVYLFTNLASTVVGGFTVHRVRSPTPRDPGWSFDREAQYTAVSFALVTVAPRVAPLLVALLATSTAVALYSVAQRPVEALTLFALSTAAPVLPIVRERITHGRREDAEQAVASAAGAIGVAMAPVLAWFVVSPGMALDVLFGAGRYDGAETALRVLALTALTWTLRGAGEFVLLAEERARRLVAIAMTGGILTVAVGAPLILAHEATGAAVAVLVSEIVMTVLLLRWVPSLGIPAARRAHVPVVAVGLLSAGALALARHSAISSVAIVVVATAAAGFWALRLLRGLEGRR